MICQFQPCGIEFAPTRTRKKFCSPNCRDESRKKVDVEKLCHMVRSGETKVEMARQFGVSYATVRRCIAEYGLQTTWRENRFA